MNPGRSVGRVLEGPGGIYFVTSEPPAAGRGRRERRKYTVRRAWPDGSIGDMGRFEQWTSAQAAHAFAGELATGCAHRPVQLESVRGRPCESWATLRGARQE